MNLKIHYSSNYVEKQGDGTDVIGTYTFSQATGTYTPITGGTVLVVGTTLMDSWGVCCTDNPFIYF